jgi:long-chain acyl-CoA synthetase
MQEKPWLNHYDDGVPQTIEYPDITVHQMLANTALKYPEKPCTIFNRAPINYRDMDKLSDRLAAGLVQAGIQPGDRVGVILPNTPQFVLAYFAILKAGGVVVAINPQFKPREIEYQINDAGIKMMIGLKGLYPLLSQLKAFTELEKIIVTKLDDFLPPIPALIYRYSNRKSSYNQISLNPGDVWLKECLYAQPPGAKPEVMLTADAIALFQYSGGTTGTSKAAIATHRNLVANALQMRHWLVNTYEGQETVLMAIPLFHVYGMVCGMLYAIRLGAAMILIPDPRDISAILRNIHQYRATVFHGVPNIFNAVNAHPEAQSGKYRLSSIKACISGSAPLMRETKEKFEALTGGKLCEGYGLSEAPTATHCNPILGENRTGSIGLPLPDVDCRIVDLEDGIKELQPGQIGELIIRGPQVMKGYHRMPEETKAVLRDGWLYTGDIARMDTDGYFYIVDRKKELIKPGGFQVWPREVEEVITSHPKVKEAGVAGVLDNQGSELVKAWVVPLPGEVVSPDEIRAYCSNQLVAYKVPSLIEFRSELPRSTVGKILRRELVREHYEQNKKN